MGSRNGSADGDTPLDPARATTSSYGSLLENSRTGADDRLKEAGSSGSSPTLTNWQRIDLFGPLICITLCTSLSRCIFVPFYPKLAESKGLRASVYGAIMGVENLVHFFATLLLGKEAEVIGVRVLLLCSVWTGGAACMLCGTLEIVAAGAAFVFFSATIRIVQVTAAAGTLVSSFGFANSRLPGCTGAIFAVNRSVTSLAKMFGPALGGVFIEWGGFSAPFIIFGMLSILSSFLLRCNTSTEEEASGTDQRQRQQARQPSAVFSSVGRLLTVSGTWVAFTAFFVSTMSTGFLSVTLEAQILRKYDLSPTQLGLMFGLKDAMVTVFSPVWGILCDRSSDVKPFIWMTSLAAAGAYAALGPVVLMPIQQKLWQVAVALCVYGTAVSGAQVSAMVDAVKQVKRSGLPDDVTTQGGVTAVWVCVTGVARFVSRCGAGLLVDWVQFRSAASLVLLMHLLMVSGAFSQPNKLEAGLASRSFSFGSRSCSDDQSEDKWPQATSEYHRPGSSQRPSDGTGAAAVEE